MIHNQTDTQQGQNGSGRGTTKSVKFLPTTSHDLFSVGKTPFIQKKSDKGIFLHEIEGLRCIGQKKETFWYSLHENR